MAESDSIRLPGAELATGLDQLAAVGEVYSILPGDKAQARIAAGLYAGPPFAVYAQLQLRLYCSLRGQARFGLEKTLQAASAAQKSLREKLTDFVGA